MPESGQLNITNSSGSTGLPFLVLKEQLPCGLSQALGVMMTLRGTGSEFFDRKRTAGNTDYEQIRERNEDILLSQPIRLQRKDPVQFWALQCNKDIAKLDTVQSRGPKGTCRQKEFWYDSQSQWFVFGGGTQLTVIGQPAVAPTVNAFAPSQEELATKKATLVCLLSGFYPRTVEVAWTKDGSPVSQGVETSQPSRQSDSKYSASSYLSLSADQWLSADTFTCKVTHDGKVIQKELSRSRCT
uniref:immunoglobulin lambda-like polypeptide 5 n=1 Tax=Phascolarctos cinereus TaxID=38626 RepID=UPI000A28CE40|nr:immunoglobulin lambda-like polypeptide 5 [Phascolarctos cinereus]